MHIMLDPNKTFFFVPGKRVAYVFGTTVVQKQLIGRFLSSSFSFLMLKVIFSKLQLKNQPVGKNVIKFAFLEL